MQAVATETAKMEPNWADLPAEIITCISEKASTNVQYVHFRVVCKAWRRALTPNPRHLPRQTPWLLLPLDPVVKDNFHLSFYDLSQSRTHRFELPYMSGKSIYSSYYGWFVLVHDWIVSLHNPITRSSIELPSLDAPPTILCTRICKREGFIPSVSICWAWKVLLSCSPSEHGCVVVVWLQSESSWELGFCRIGDTHWTRMNLRDAGQNLWDVTCHNNSVYLVNTKSEVLAYDLESLAIRIFPSKINHNGIHRIHLVEGDVKADGPLVVIFTSEYLLEIKEIYVYKWINSEQQWRQVKNIGKSVLFLSHFNCSKLQLEEQQGNEIYYAIGATSSFESFHICINKMNMQSGGIIQHWLCPTELFYNNNSGLTSWFTPSLI